MLCLRDGDTCDWSEAKSVEGETKLMASRSRKSLLTPVSFVNPDDWPHTDLKPSQGSKEGQQYVVPGGEKIDNLGECTAKVRTERHCGGDTSSRMTFQSAKVRKVFLCLQYQEGLT